MNSLRGAVLGSPIEHSLSPLLHRTAFNFLGIEGEYARCEVAGGTLKEFFNSHSEEYSYLSLTMPLKEEALALNVEVDPLSQKIQSSNTLYRRDGRWSLTSTDGSGFLRALDFNRVASLEKVLVLGAGGTARAIVGALDGRAREITVMGRTSSRQEVLEGIVSESHFRYIPWGENPDFEEFDLVVNTTPAGAADLLADALFDKNPGALFEVIYKPWPTVLASRWEDRGGLVIGGLELLIYQGIFQLQIALNRDLPVEELADHLREVLYTSLGYPQK